MAAPRWRRAGLIGALALVMVAAACTTSSSSEPASRSFPLPGLVVSADTPVSTVVFDLRASTALGPEDDDVVMSISFQPAADAGLEVVRDGVGVSRRDYECRGATCLGSYTLTATWTGGTAGAAAVEPWIDVSATQTWLRRTTLGAASVTPTAGASLVARGRVSLSERQWVAVRDQTGQAVDRNIVLEVVPIRTGRVRMVNGDTVTVLPPGQHPLQLEGCDGGPCGMAMTLETETSHLVGWRLVDYGPFHVPLSVDVRDEAVPRAQRRLFPSVPGVKAGPISAAYTYELPAQTLRGATPERPAWSSFSVRIDGVPSDGEPPTIAVRVDGELRTSDEAEDVAVDLGSCVESAPCRFAIEVEVTPPDSAPEAVYRPTVSGYAALPYLHGVGDPPLVLREVSE